MKRLLLIVPNLKMGGQERAALRTAEALGTDFEIFLCVFDGREPFYDGTPFHLIDLNIPASHNRAIRVFHFFMRIRAMRKLKRRLNTDYSYSFGMTANLVNIFSKCSDLILVSIRGYASTQGRLNSQALIPLIVKKADLVFALTEQMKERLTDCVRTGKEKVKTLYNPYSINDIRQKAAEGKKLRIEGKLIATMGRLVPIKGIPHLLRAVKHALQSVENVKLIILGDGGEREKLEELIHELGMEKQVFLLGNVSNPFGYLSQCDLYCLTSYHEGFPNALVEAMACGLPVISADCKSGPREILGYEGNKAKIEKPVRLDAGVLIPAFETMEEVEEEKERILASEIVRMLSEDNLKLKYRSGLNRRCEAFSMECYRNNLVRLMGEGE